MPDTLIRSLGREIVYKLATGDEDITGNGFSSMFAEVVHSQAVDHKSPVGVADVSWESHAWSVKTVQSQVASFNKQRVRLISGRNNPGYSMGIEEPMKDPQATGRAVIEILNARIDDALAEFNDLRLLVFVRNMKELKFCIFEKELERFSAEDIIWKVNRHSNLQGYDKEEIHRLTWQRHGSQLTVIHAIPQLARIFTVRRPPSLDKDDLLASIGFKENWVQVEK